MGRKKSSKMFSIKLEQITFERIKAFCKEKHPEGDTIEYKQAFPSDTAKLAKSISAMANTQGGIILIGVRADKTTNTPIMPIEGIELTQGLEEKVTSICLTHIYHPYFPLVKVCDFKNHKGEDRAVVFIRIYESDQTPHAINNNTDVYFRIRSQNEPFKKATVDEIEWLKYKRRKTVELRESMLARANERYDTLAAPLLDPLRRGNSREVFVSPVFPSRQLISSYDLCDHIDKLEGLGHDSGAGIIRNLAKTANETFYYFETRPGTLENKKWISYGELTSYGSVLLKESWWEDCHASSSSKFDAMYFLRQVHRTLKFALKFYSAVGYQGILKVGVRVQGMRKKKVGCSQPSDFSDINVFLQNELDDTFVYDRNVLISELDDNLDSTITDIYKQFLFACGFGIDKEQLNRVATKHVQLMKERQKIAT
jgi:hypothetical protein